MTYQIVIISNRPRILLTRTWNKIIIPANLQKRCTIYCPPSVRNEMDELFPGIRKFNDKHKGFRGALLDARKTWKEGAHIVKIDDDVTAIKHLSRIRDPAPDRRSSARGTKLLTVRNVGKVFSMVFSEMKKRNARLGGFYITPNELWMKKSDPITERLTFIYGACFCMIYRAVPFHTIGKVDFERSIHYFIKDGKVLRFNRFAVVSKYKGGTTDTDKKDNAIMVRVYGDFISRIKQNSNGLTSIVFKRGILPPSTP